MGYSITERLELTLSVPMQELWMDALINPRLPESYLKELQYTDKYHPEDRDGYPLLDMHTEPVICIGDGVSGYAERAHAGMMETTAGAYSQNAVYMPALRADGYLQEAIDAIARSVSEEDALGVNRIEGGEIPFIVYPETNPLGVTGFDEDGNPVMMGVSSSVLRSYDKLERVLRHEMTHADSAALLKYADVPDYLARAIIEGYAEYRAMRNHPEQAREILSDTPYGKEIAIAQEIEHSYVSEDGARGYRAFMKDVMEHESMAYALRQLERSINDLQGRVSAN
ncbi:MAG: hypothetical protein HY365_00770 [Candidatus Aenigmarchaeota archaeon]|nr:hypothetical protein [Candidatus Aenigmarchaeota archaeon]